MYPDPDTLPGITPGPADEPVTEPKPIWSPCDFCGRATKGDRFSPTGWAICLRSDCWHAAYAQKERMYAGLVDCKETRRSALQWVTRDQKKK